MNPEAEDYVLAGNIMRGRKQLQKAVDYYLKAFGFKGFEMKNLEDSFAVDCKNDPQTKEENNLITDYIFYKLNENN